MSKILKNVWIGGYEEVYDKDTLSYINPTHILNCTDNLRLYYREIPIKVHRIPLIDDIDDDIQLIEDGADKLEEWIKEGGRVIVHCAAGMSRSPTVVIAWLIKYNKHTLDEAYEIVQSKRNIIRPNNYYLKCLKQIYNKYNTIS